MSDDPGLGWRVVKRLSDPDVAAVAAAVGNPGIDEVILANPNYPAERIVRLVDFCHEHHIIFKFVPNIYQTLTTHYDVDAIDQVPVVELQRTSLAGWGRIFKRSFDIVGSSFALLILSPVFAAVAFAIKWGTEGPVFVRLKRVSKNREFDLLKFRSMIDNAHELNPYFRSIRNDRPDAGPLWKMKDDPRITRVGKFIRRYRIDELPQFINVLRGEMSIVGPRPHQPDEIERYEKHHKKVLAIKAGATGMAQVSGASDIPFEEEVALDTFYIENWSLLLDIRICLKTVLKMFSDTSAV
jgi:exopolysaccharide biosynthesis polyprenyl glycosylphosphotransferase